MGSVGRILVIGGTGTLGAPVARQLDAAGWDVRVMSRTAAQARDRLGPRIDLFAGDADRPEDLERALTGCKAALICVSQLLDPYLDARVTQNVVAFAPGLGVERIGLISGASVAEDRRHYAMIDAKFQAEEALKAGRTPWVIFRPTWVMEGLARFVRGNRATVLGHHPHTVHPVAGDDVGRMVSRAFLLDDAVGRTFAIQGPEATTVRRWLEDWCALARPDLRVSSVPLWLMSAVATLSRDRELKAVVEMMRYFEGTPEHGDPTEANRLLGAPTITLARWAASQPAAAPSEAA